MYVNIKCSFNIYNNSKYLYYIVKAYKPKITSLNQNYYNEREKKSKSKIQKNQNPYFRK